MDWTRWDGIWIHGMDGMEWPENARQTRPTGLHTGCVSTATVEVKRPWILKNRAPRLTRVMNQSINQSSQSIDQSRMVAYPCLWSKPSFKHRMQMPEDRTCPTLSRLKDNGWMSTLAAGTICGPSRSGPDPGDAPIHPVPSHPIKEAPSGLFSPREATQVSRQVRALT